MLQFSQVEDDKLREIMKSLDSHLRDLIEQRKGYSFSKLIGYRDDLISAFAKYVKHRRSEIKEELSGYETTKKEVQTGFKYDEQAIISTFTRQVERAFGQAAYSIEKSLGETVTNPGFFGTRALLSLLNKRPKVQDLKRVEGISRLAKVGDQQRIFRLDLMPYLFLLLRTVQVEWNRKLGENIAYATRVDLAYISPWPCWLGPQADEVCNRWRDRLVSLDGRTAGFPALAEAKSERPPLFHPHCTHKIHPLTPEEEQKAIAKKVRTYSQLKKYL